MQPTCLHLRLLARVGVTISRSHDKFIILIIGPNFLLNLIQKKNGVEGKISCKIFPSGEIFSIYYKKHPLKRKTKVLPLLNFALWAMVMPDSDLYDRVCEM